MVFSGSELFWDKSPGLFSRLYCGMLGVPISGLRIRLRRVLPSLTGNPKKVIAWLGRNSQHKKGVGVLVLATK